MNIGKELLRQAIFPSPEQKERQDLDGLMRRINELENTDHEYEVFRVIESGTEGKIELPEGVSIRLDQYPDLGDCLITGGAGGRPIDAGVYTAAGVHIAGTLDSGGNYTLSGVPAAYPVYIVFQVECKGKSVSQISLAERV